jgi:hypothetical protein
MEEYAYCTNEAPEVNVFGSVFPTGLIDVEIERIGDITPDPLGNRFTGVRDSIGDVAGRTESDIKVKEIFNDFGKAAFAHPVLDIEICNGSMQPGSKG